VNDKQIRLALHRTVFQRCLKQPGTVLLEELGIRHGAARADLVLINGALHGFEVKSDRDSLSRLENQVRLFNSVFDRMTLVVGYRHAGIAIKMISDWWGVKLAYAGPRGGVRLSDARAPRNNPEVDKHLVVKLLWKSEALEILTTLGLQAGIKSKSRKFIYQRLAEKMDLDFIREKTREALRARRVGRSAVQSELDDDLLSLPTSPSRVRSFAFPHSSP
jgi:AAA+ ATPase superfamily predicted ATPase